MDLQFTVMAPTPNVASQVRVGVRIRPLTPKESSEGGRAVVDGNALNRTVSLSKRKFTYDFVFHSNATQSDLYTSVAPPLLRAFLNGYNGEHAKSWFNIFPMPSQ